MTDWPRDTGGMSYAFGVALSKETGIGPLTLGSYLPGANVSALEIDQVIRACPGVKISQTVGVADELLGEMVVACVVPHAQQMLTEKFVRDFAKKTLASYKVPRRVLFFAEHELKTTGSAKIITAELRKIASARIEAESAQPPAITADT